MIERVELSDEALDRSCVAVEEEKLILGATTDELHAGADLPCAASLAS